MPYVVEPLSVRNGGCPPYLLVEAMRDTICYRGSSNLMYLETMFKVDMLVLQQCCFG